MSDWARLLTTMIIWGTLAGILISTANRAGDLNTLAFVLGLGATISTGFVWMGSSGHRTAPEQESMKAKRSARVSRLVDNLDEDEVYQLEELLAARRDDPYLQQK